MDEVIVQLVVLAVFGAIVSAIAHSRGRSPIGWFFIGAIAPCIGLILVLVLPDLNVEEERRQRLRRDNQRLREQIRKERQVADQRHAETLGRLGAHDAVLGLDTAGASAGRLGAGEASPDRPVPHRAERTSSIDPDSRWHYAVDEHSGTNGPVDFAEIASLWHAGELDDRSLLWQRGMDDWKTIADLPDVLDELHNA